MNPKSFLMLCYTLKCILTEGKSKFWAGILTKPKKSEVFLGCTVMWNGESSPNSITKNISDRQFDARIFDKLNLKIVFPKILQERLNMTKIKIKFSNFCSAMNDFFISCYAALFKLNWSIISVTSIGRPEDLKA